jgi:5-methylcytosine-specific restriction endonuclease McrA
MTWNKGKQWSKIKDISDRLVEHSTYSSGLPISSYKLKNQLLKLGYKNHVCESCGLDEWVNRPIPLELHHINGNKFDNRIENLQLLCPNCHSFTDNYRAKNMSAR